MADVGRPWHFRCDHPNSLWLVLGHAAQLVCNLVCKPTYRIRPSTIFLSPVELARGGEKASSLSCLKAISKHCEGSCDGRQTRQSVDTGTAN